MTNISYVLVFQFPLSPMNLLGFWCMRLPTCCNQPKLLVRGLFLSGNTSELPGILGCSLKQITLQTGWQEWVKGKLIKALELLK